MNRTDAEARRYCKNWTVIALMSSLVGVAYFIAIPSLHQFVTSSPTPLDPTVQPGLGLNEVWYAWIVGISSLGEFTGALMLGMLLRWMYAKHLMLLELSVCAAGALLYSIGKFGWMLLLGRYFIGFYQGGQMVVLRAYLGETSNHAVARLPPERQKKSNLKYTLFFVTFLASTLCNAVGPGLAGIAAEIPGLDQFRWPGYYLIIHSVVLAVVVLVLFREKRNDLKRSFGHRCSWERIPIPIYTVAYFIFAFFINNWQFTITDTLLNPILGDSFGLSIQYDSYVFLGSLVFLAVGNTTMYVLRRCGLDARLIGVIALLCGVTASLILTEWQAIRGDPCEQFSENRYVLPSGPFNGCKENGSILSLRGLNITLENSSTPFKNAALVLLYAEVSVSCDKDLCILPNRTKMASSALWDHDILCSVPCHFVDKSSELYCYWLAGDVCLRLESTEFSNNLPISESNCNTSRDETNSRFFLAFNTEDNATTAAVTCLLAECEPWGVGTDSNWSPSQSRQDLQHSNYSMLDDCSLNASCVCEAFSSPPYNCFWNPNSRITGEHCHRCEPLCRSRQHTIAFPQLIIGVMLLTLAFAMSRIVITLILSVAMGTASQSLVMGALVAAGSAARFSGPLWGNEVYLAAGRRTYLVMMILTGLMLTVFLLFLILFRTMKPRRLGHLAVPTSEPSPTEQGDAGRNHSQASDEVLLLDDMECEEETTVLDGTDNHLQKGINDSGNLETSL